MNFFNRPSSIPKRFWAFYHLLAKNGFLILMLSCAVNLHAAAAEQREDVLKPYDGPSNPGVDTSTLKGKVMTGYQGWFNCEGDGANRGWTHWTKDSERLFGPGNISVDLWPDVSEYDDDELYATGFTYKDGTRAKTFSSYNRKTVLRHFKWMRDYGIDGAFVQRFVHRLNRRATFHHRNKVLSSAREGANRYGRAYAVMYDITGLFGRNVEKVFDDWRVLRDKMHITEDPAYQHYKGKPLVAIWGVGFNNEIKRRASLDVCRKLIEKFKASGCSVMLGIPTGWRAQNRDALSDPELHSVLLMADVLSPWSIGRVRTLPGVEEHAKEYWGKDIVWAREHNIDYMPVVFPGFSWHNMKGDKLASIPRLKGRFMWSQVVALKKAGADMLYIAMFDEVDEGTAIFKCSNNPPTSGGAEFLTLEGLPSDFYLRLAGESGKLLRDEIPLTAQVPLTTEKPRK
ncbi:MAG: xylosidase/arabinosidase [Candidatus Hydrogenedentes bacterium]|nr:xylosidase/arabinosidase [Candidatus Hydrogenedentota bacterium]